MLKDQGVVAAVGLVREQSKDPIRIAMYLLPGPTRSQDRMVPVDRVRLTDYVQGVTPAEGARLWDEASPGVARGVLCEWEDGRREIVPFVVPCYSSREWSSLEKAAESLGCVLERGDEVQETESIGRSVLTSLMCLLDGTVHETKRFGAGMVLFARRWPVLCDAAALA